FKTRIAVSASAALSKAKYVTARRPSAAAEMPRRLMPASASARLIFVPSPARSAPSTCTECRLSVVVRPPAWAAPFCFAPLMGASKTTHAPGLSGARREMRNSKFAPASLKALNLSANPPGRSAISPAHTSTFLIVYAMLAPPLNNFLTIRFLYKTKTDHSNGLDCAKVIGSFSFLLLWASFHPTMPHIAVMLTKDEGGCYVI